MRKETIRFATPADIPDILQLCGLHAEFEQAGLNSAAFQSQSNQKAIGEMLFGLTPVIWCLVVEIDGRSVGYATYARQYSTWLAKSYLYLDCLFLNESARGSGTGKRMMERVAQEAHKLGCEHIEWQTPELNLEAIGFYRRLGATDKPKQRFSWPVNTSIESETFEPITDNNPILELPAEATPEPYRPRRTQMIGTRDCHDWTFKVYEITVDDSKISSAVIASAMDFVQDNVTWPDVSSKFGFVIVHAGEQAVWVLVHLWMNDILRQFIFCAPLSDPTNFSVSPMDGFNACVWELEVTRHERDAWVDHVLSFPLDPRHEAYLSDSLEILGESHSK